MKAIVTGISGQDGYYTAKLLERRGCNTLGLSSNANSAAAHFPSATFPNLKIIDFDYSDVGLFSSIVEQYQPDIILNFAAKATGKGMFEAPYEMNRLNGAFVLDILEAIRTSKRRDQISFCQASSSEMFGRVEQTPQSERTPFRPKSPYGASKLYAHNILNIYRSTYGIQCCSAILYNHESVRRSTEFVTKKIAYYAAAISLGFEKELTLGSLAISRDWGYAPEYVEAMYRMVTAANMKDYIVATGTLSTIGNLCDIVFNYLGLDYRDYVRVNDKNKRVVDSLDLHGNPERIERDLGWRAERGIEDIMIELVNFELKRLQSAGVNQPRDRKA